MNRLHYVNLIGVLALALLCVTQWRHNRDLNLEVNRLEQVRLDQTAKLTEQQKVVSGVNADLAQFKEQFGQAEAALNDERQKLRRTEREIGQLTAERDQLKTSVTNWAEAVAIRDTRLKEAGAQIRRLGEELNASIGRFNALATNHNAVVKDLNDLRALGAKPPATRPPNPAPQP